MVTYFPNGQVQRKDFLLPDTGAGSQNPDIDPDLAYDREYGHLYIFYSKGETPLGIHENTIRYVGFWRGGYEDPRYPYPLHVDVIFEDGWGDVGEWPRKVAREDDHNGHAPSVAIGQLDFFMHDDGPPRRHYWVEDHRWICFAYTSQFDDQTGFHVHAGGWELKAGGFDERKIVDLRHPDLDPLSAGMPCISMSPRSARRDYAALVLTQIVGSDGYGPMLRVFPIELFGYGHCTEAAEWFQVPTPSNDDDCLYPSIALHDNDNEEGPFYTSLTYMSQWPQNDILRPAVTLITTNLVINDEEEPYLQAVRQASYTAVIPDAINIRGNYNYSQIPFIDPGVSTSLVVNDGLYWAAWSERIEMEPPPECVYGTYGWIGN